jgi:hypothetical protein
VRRGPVRGPHVASTLRLFLTALRETGPAGRLVPAPMTAKDPAEKPTNIADAAPPPQTNHERSWRRERQKPNKTGGAYKFLVRALYRKIRPNRYRGSPGPSRAGLRRFD